MDGRMYRNTSVRTDRHCCHDSQIEAKAEYILLVDLKMSPKVRRPLPLKINIYVLCKDVKLSCTGLQKSFENKSHYSTFIPNESAFIKKYEMSFASRISWLTNN